MSVAVETLPWDSHHFGFPVGRVVEPPKTEADLRGVLHASRALRCVYLLVDVDDTIGTRLAEEGGFHLRDVRVGLQKQTEKIDAERVSASPDRPYATRRATTADAAALCAIAGHAYRDSRFYADPGFPRERVDEMYRIWVRRCLEDDAGAVWIEEAASGIAGFVACRAGEISLVGVAPQHRGQGVAQHLLSVATDWFAASGVDRIRVVTQGRNTAALRLYERAGFTVERMALWYHLWPKDVS